MWLALSVEAWVLITISHSPLMPMESTFGSFRRGGILEIEF